MGGRGKSSGVARRAGPPMNFGDHGAISLEEFESAEGPPLPLWIVGPSPVVAKGVEEAVEGVLSASPEDYARRHEEMIRLVTAAAQEMQRRPVKEREVFSERLAPLFEQLREQAKGAT